MLAQYKPSVVTLLLLLCALMAAVAMTAAAAEETSAAGGAKTSSASSSHAEGRFGPIIPSRAKAGLTVVLVLSCMLIFLISLEAITMLVSFVQRRKAASSNLDESRTPK